MRDTVVGAGSGRRRSIGVRTLAWLCGALPAAAGASSAGPQPGSTGAPVAVGGPAEMTCASCHATYPLNPDDRGRIDLSGLPARYAPGRRYTLVFSIAHPDPALLRWGFQLTALSATTLAGAGAFVITDPGRTQRIDGVEGARQYVEHTMQGTGTGSAGGQRWTFDWIAPAREAGEVAFYGAANAANLDGSEKGDRIFTTSPEPLARISPE